MSSWVRFRRYLLITEFRLRGFRVVSAFGDRRITTQPFFYWRANWHEMFVA